MSKNQRHYSNAERQDDMGSSHLAKIKREKGRSQDLAKASIPSLNAMSSDVCNSSSLQVPRSGALIL